MWKIYFSIYSSAFFRAAVLRSHRFSRLAVFMARAGQLWEWTAVIENPKGPFQFVNWHDNVRDRIFEWETASPPYYRLVFAFRVRLAFICTCCPHWLSSLICRLAACVASVLHMEKTRLQFHGDQIFSWLGSVSIFFPSSFSNFFVDIS